MIEIKSINTYRDGGSVAILLRNIDPLLIESLGLPDYPKQLAGKGDTCNLYEIWIDQTRDDSKHGKYFWGDINGENVELQSEHMLMVRVLELLKEVRELRVASIDVFINGFNESK